MQTSSGSPSPETKVSGNKRNVRLERVRHIDGASNFPRGHVVANVDVAQLGDAQPIQRGGKIRHRHIDALNRVTQAPRGKSVGGGEKRKASSHNCGILEETPPRRTESTRDRSRMSQKAGRDVRDPLNRSHRFDCQESKEGGDQPQARKCRVNALPRLRLPRLSRDIPWPSSGSSNVASNAAANAISPA